MQAENPPNKKYNFVGHILCGDFNIEPSSLLHRFFIKIFNKRFFNFFSFLIDQKINLRTRSSNMAFKTPSNVDNFLPIFGLPPPISNIPLALMSLSNNCELGKFFYWKHGFFLFLLIEFPI